METKTLEQNWSSYMAAYNSTVKEERDLLLAQSVSPDVVFTNPGGEGESRAEMSAHIEKFQKAMPGKSFRTEKVFVHHGELLASWSMHNQDGTKIAAGFNFVRPDPDGKFSYMAGFF